MRRVVSGVVIAATLAAIALLAVGGSLSGPPKASPDGLFYQARVYELRGLERSAALDRAFGSELAADLRRVDPERSGNRAWGTYNAKFYDRRLSVPLAAAALEPVSGERALLDVSIAGYVVAVLAVFVLLALRFSLGVAAVVTLLTTFLPTLTQHAAQPLTDSWGLALQTAALAVGLLVLQRGQRWLIPWFGCILLLSLTREAAWILVIGAAWLTLNERSRISALLLLSGLLAAIPSTLIIEVSVRELLSQMLNDLQPAPGRPWHAIAAEYPAALVQLVRANGGYVRDGAWYSAAFLCLGLLLLFLCRGQSRDDSALRMLRAAAVAGIGYVLVIPVFSAFRLELALVPMVAYGWALGFERIISAMSAPAFLRLGTLRHDLASGEPRRPSRAAARNLT